MGGILSLQAAADVRNSHSCTLHDSKLTRILWNFPHLQAQSHAIKRYLAVEPLPVTPAERKGLVLFCVTCGSVAANHGSDKSRRGLMTKWRTMWSSPIQKWQD